MNEKLKKMVFEILGNNDVPDEIDGDSDLILDLGYDSLSFVQLLVEIEDEFGIHLNDTLSIDIISKYSELERLVNEKIEES